MRTYLALLRGINVGGKNIIKMAKLKEVFEAIGLCEVQTYIQSGNVLFKSNEGEELLRAGIEHAIDENFGITLSIVLRTAAELNEIILNCPFTEEQISEAELQSEAECLYVSLLTNIPTQDKMERFSAYKSDMEEYRIIGREVYLLFHQSIRNSKLANNLQKLDSTATVRNWKTMNKLAELAKIMCM
jgi:uncharacterized protein (DUF1697 family)